MQKCKDLQLHIPLVQEQEERAACGDIKIGPEKYEEQFGFRKGKGTRNAIFTTNMISERATEMRRDTVYHYCGLLKSF